MSHVLDSFTSSTRRSKGWRVGVAVEAVEDVFFTCELCAKGKREEAASSPCWLVVTSDLHRRRQSASAVCWHAVPG